MVDRASPQMRWSEGVVQLKTPALDRCCFVALTEDVNVTGADVG